MVKFRVIPWIEVKGSNLIKGINMEGLRVLGTPYKYSKFYSENGADELIYYDVVASLYGRNSILDIISQTSEQTFIPITVCGGIRSILDIKKVLKAGADRVCINSAAIKNPNFIAKAAEVFGSSTICVNIQTLRDKKGKYFCYYNHGRELTNIRVEDWVKLIEKKGAGEIVLSSIDREGTFQGIDKELILKIKKLIRIPLIVHGGCKGPLDIHEIFKKINFNGVAVASLFHYHLIKKFKKEIIKNFKSQKIKSEGNIEYLMQNKSVYSYLYKNTFSIKNFKKILINKKINTRI